MRLYDFLTETGQNGRVPFHMPGHARDGARFDWLRGMAEIDFTEIDGLDDLHAPEGILRDAMARAASRYGADRTFFLVGGSTVGVLAAVSAVCRAVCRASRAEHPLLLVGRNCHKSVYHAALINRVRLKYLTPALHPLGFTLDITPESVRAALAEGEKPAAVIVVSPTYDGVVSDVEGIAAVCHRSGVPLIVDAAHGAHLGFLDPAVPSPVICGADFAVMSLHKTLPSLTQTGLLHVNGALVDPDSAAEALNLYETSSPSYPLMASADGCVGAMGDATLFAEWRARIREMREAAGDLLLKPSGVFAFDDSKLILAVPGLSGPETARILREEYNIEPETTSLRYVLLMTGAGTSEKHVRALKKALNGLSARRTGNRADVPEGPPRLPASRYSPAETDRMEKEVLPLGEAAGRVAGTMITVYPPGIPLIVPGEVLDEDIIDEIRRQKAGGANLLTSRDPFDGTLPVCREETK